MSGGFQALLRGLNRNAAFTSAGAQDPRLRGRTYAVPFDDVWRAAMKLVGGGLKGWKVVESDDQEGVIRGVARGRLKRFHSSITIRITLDADAQTRVDGLSASRVGRADLGVNTRRLHRFFRTLDRQLAEARGTEIETFRLDLPASTSRA